MTELRTERLILRQWRDSDREPFAELNADPETMRYFPAPLTREESDAVVDRASGHIDEHGWGWWAVEVAGGAPFVGFVGLARPQFAQELVEVGWRRRDRLLHHGRERALTESHGANRHDTRSLS